MIEYIICRYYLLRYFITDLLFGKEEVPEVQEDDYVGGQCFYDVKTGKHECE